MNIRYIVTQKFFDNTKYFRFLDLAAEAGIKSPIIPGIKILNSINQLNSIPRNFYIDIPEALSDEILKNPNHIKEIGIEWAANQCKELLAKGIKNLHFFIMDDISSIEKVMKKIMSRVAGSGY